MLFKGEDRYRGRLAARFASALVAAVERIERFADAAHSRARRQGGRGRDEGDRTQAASFGFSFGGRGRLCAVRWGFCRRRWAEEAKGDLRALAHRFRRFESKRELFERLAREVGLARLPCFNRQQFLGEIGQRVSDSISGCRRVRNAAKSCVSAAM